MKQLTAALVFLVEASACNAARFVPPADGLNVVNDEYIVTFKAPTTAAQEQTETVVAQQSNIPQPAALERTEKLFDRIIAYRQRTSTPQSKVTGRHKDRIRQIYNGRFPGFAGHLSKIELTDVLNDDDVEVVEPNYYVTSTGSGVDVPPLSWALDRIDQRAGTDNGYLYNATGSGVHVFVVDTGMNAALPEFAGRVGEGFDAYGQGYTGDCEYEGHGTAMAGLIAGTKSGVAKQAIIHPVRTNDCRASTLAELIAGINWAASTNYRPAVLNISLSAGWSQTYREIPQSEINGQNFALKNALINARNRGIVVIAGAGNDGKDSCMQIIAGSVWYTGGAVVSGTDYTDMLYGYRPQDLYTQTGSSGGPCTTINAPWFASSVWKDPSQFEYGAFEGSSVSSALVSGAVALILGAYPGIDPLNDGARGLYANATLLTPDQAGQRFSYIAPAGMHPNNRRFLYTRYITDPPPAPPVFGNPRPPCGRMGGGRC